MKLSHRVFLMIAVLMLILCACYKAAPTVPAQTAPVTEPAESMVPETTPPVPTQVSAEFIIERFLNQRPDHIFFSDAADSPYASKILLTFSTDISDFRFFAVEGTLTDAGEFVCTKQSNLFTREQVTAEDLLVVQTELGEILPVKGISFLDSTNTIQSYYLQLSGKDNLPILIPFS